MDTTEGRKYVIDFWKKERIYFCTGCAGLILKTTRGESFLSFCPSRGQMKAVVPVSSIENLEKLLHLYKETYSG